MADEGDQMQMEQSVECGQVDSDHAGGAGGGGLRIRALHDVFVTSQKLTKDLGAQPGADQRAAEPHAERRGDGRDAGAGSLGMTKKELAQKTAELRAQQKAAEARLEKEQKEQIGQVTRRHRRREDRRGRSEDRRGFHQGRSRSHQGQAAEHDRRSRRAERTDRPHAPATWKS